MPKGKKVPYRYGADAETLVTRAFESLSQDNKRNIEPYYMAYMNQDKDEKEYISCMIIFLANEIKGMSPLGALELFWKVNIFINANGRINNYRRMAG